MWKSGNCEYVIATLFDVENEYVKNNYILLIALLTKTEPNNLFLIMVNVKYIAIVRVKQRFSALFAHTPHSLFVIPLLSKAVFRWISNNMQIFKKIVLFFLKFVYIHLQVYMDYFYNSVP